MLLSNGHGLGRSSLSRLAAHVAGMKLFQPDAKESDKDRVVELRNQLKLISQAALLGKPCLLVTRPIKEQGCLQDLCDFIKQG